jgi:hypothetical protein
MSQTTDKLLFNNLHFLNQDEWEIINQSNFYKLIAGSETKPFSKKNVFIIFSDHLGDDRDFLSCDLEHKPHERLIQIIQDNPDQNFYVFCGILNFHQIEKTYPNVKIIHWADEMFVISNCHYTEILPQREKNFDSKKHWISVSQNKRIPRYLVGMYLLGENLDRTGLLRFDPSELLEHDSWDSYVSYWKYNDREKEIAQLLSCSSSFKKGFYKVKNKQGYESNQYRGPTDPETAYLNIEKYHKNFDLFLKPLYKNSFIEIVIETVVFQKYGLITEKFLNSVYGFNLPILLGVPGSIAHLKSIGFDMFDSVIDYSYESIIDPIPRLIHALDRNKELLQNSELAKLAWKKCLPGLEHNFQLAQEIERNLESSFNTQLLDILK